MRVVLMEKMIMMTLQMKILPHIATYVHGSDQKHECFQTYLTIKDETKLTKNL